MYLKQVMEQIYCTIYHLFVSLNKTPQGKLFTEILRELQI